MTPRTGPILTPVHLFGRHWLDDVSCRIFKLLLFRFSKRRYFKFFLSVAMASRVLLGIKFFEQFLKLTTKTKETFLWSLDEIGLPVYDEMSFKVKVYGRTPDEKRSQKLTMSLCDWWAKNNNNKKKLFHCLERYLPHAIAENETNWIIWACNIWYSD
jgi:hypothetical protein